MKALLVTVKQARILLNIGNTKLYDLLSNGLLEKRKIGSKTLVTMRSIEKLADISIDAENNQKDSNKTNINTKLLGKGNQSSLVTSLGDKP